MFIYYYMTQQERKESFNHIPDWINGLTNVNFDNVIFALVGNKIDLDDKREVSKEEGIKLAEEKKCIFEEVSAKTAENFSELFYKQLFDEIVNKFKPGVNGNDNEINDEDKIKIDDNTNKKQEGKKCCK